MRKNVVNGGKKLKRKEIMDEGSTFSRHGSLSEFWKMSVEIHLKGILSKMSYMLGLRLFGNNSFSKTEKALER